MNIGVIKLGARISFESLGTSGGTGETVSIIKMLQYGGANVIAYTKILKGEKTEFTNIKIKQILDYYDNINSENLDALVVLNGTVNFFGGAEDKAQLANYHIINNFKGQIFYIYCDPSLILKQIWPSVEKKEWAKNYKKENIEITRKDIIYLSQPYDIKEVSNIINKDIFISKIVHFPFEQFPCLNERLSINENPIVDLSYGGTMRGGRRENKMLKFYFDYPFDINVEMFGKINKEDFKAKNLQTIINLPKFTGPVNYDKMLLKMNESLSHIVIGDKLYEKINDIPQRLYESISAGCITFIDSDMDKMRRIYKSNELRKFLYVNSKLEVIDKIRNLKNDISLRKDILKNTLIDINFNSKKYCESFVNILEKQVY